MERVCDCATVHCQYESHVCTTTEMWQNHDHTTGGVRTPYDSGGIITGYDDATATNPGHHLIAGMGVGTQHGVKTSDDFHSGSAQCDASDSLRVYHANSDEAGHHCKLSTGGRSTLHQQSPVTDAAGVSECMCRCNNLFTEGNNYNPKTAAADLFDHTIGHPTGFAPTQEPTSYPTRAPTAACVPGRFAAGGAGACQDCAHGSISTTYNAAGCTTCPNGRYAVATEVECSECQIGKYHEATGEACKQCEAGKYQEWTAQESCKHCVSGKYQATTDFTTCVECSVSQWTEDKKGQVACVDKPTDCAGAYFGTLADDVCGVCDGPGKTGCDLQCGSAKTYDECGVCDGPGKTGCDLECGSAKTDDECGVCDGPGKTGCDLQCGSAKVDDSCGVCDGPGPAACGCGDATSCLDCAGTPYGPHTDDQCGVCNGADACLDCAGTPNGYSVVDECGVCDGGNACHDCAGTPNGLATRDCAGDCNGPAVIDCSGLCNGPAVEDCNGLCDGTAVIGGCDSTCGSTKVDDCAGTCGGTEIISGCDNTCSSTKVDDGCGCGVTCPVDNCVQISCPQPQQGCNYVNAVFAPAGCNDATYAGGATCCMVSCGTQDCTSYSSIPE
jgi:hypothetical protein